ncbi:MAG: type IV secretory system conjugative DNA transfer family protein [Oscillospiraceae bacterium]|nr:type IV secretory system conjugative DNA transfer family protein [Oscillospiraceae bacterium]
MCSTKNERILAKDVYVSNDTKITGLNNNDMIIGSSGSGKTGGYVIPNLQNITGSVIVSDTKGQLRRMFENELRDKGYDVYCLDFVDPLNSCGYNPLAGIRQYKNGKYREQDILSLANTIMPSLDSREPFWEKAAAGFIAFLIAFCLEALPEEEHTMKYVCDIYNMFIKPGGDLSFVQWTEEHPDSFASIKYNQIKSIMAADKMWSSIQEFVNRALEPFSFEEAKHIFNNPDTLDIASLGRKKTVLFLNTSDTDRTFDDLVNTFHTQALQILCSVADANPDGRLEIPVRIIMDDFAAGTRIPDFDKVISVIRSRDISVSLILQSMTQLESMYNKAEALTIINNCDHILYLGCQDIETAEFIGTRAFKTVDNVLCLDRDKAILITKGEKAKIVDKIMPYSTMDKAG